MRIEPWGERDWGGAPVYEIGWAVLPAFQGRGLAAPAKAAAGATPREVAERRFPASPSVENEPSNRVCRRGRGRASGIGRDVQILV